MAWQLGVDSATGMCTEAGASAVLRDISSDPTNWFYLPFKGHRGRVSCVAFSPDGTQVVTGGEDQTIRFWNLKGRPVDTLLGHTGPVNSIQFSADKKWMASVSLDSTVRIWGLDGKPLHVLRHSSFVEAVRMPRKSKLLLTTCTDTIWAWDVETGARQQGWALHEEGAADVVFSTTDSLMATVRGGRVKLWTQGGRFIDSLFRGKYIERVRFDPQGRYIVGAGNNTIYRISRSALHQVDSLLSDTGTGFFHLSADGGWVFWGGMYSHVWYCSLEEFKAPHYFSYEGGMAVSRGSLNSGMQFLGGENLCLWRDPNVEPVVLRSGARNVNDAAFSEDGRWLLTGDDSGMARLWFAANDWPSMQPSWMRTQYIDKEISPDQRHLLVKGSQDPVLLNLVTQEMVSLPIPNVQRTVFSPDGSLLAVTTYSDSLIHFFDSTGTLRFQRALQGGRAYTNAELIFSPDDERLLLLNQENRMILMRLKDGRCSDVPHAHREELSCVWAPDGRHFSTYSSGDSVAYLWSAEGQLVASLRGHQSRVIDAIFLDGARLLTKSRGGCIFWNMSGQEVGRLSGSDIAISSDNRRILAHRPQRGYWVHDVDAKPLYALERTEQMDRSNNFLFSFDGRYLVNIQENESEFWSPTGKYLFHVEGQVFNTAQKHDAFLFPNGDVLALSRNQDKYTLRRWDTQGKLVKIYEGLDEAPNRCEVSADGRYITASNFQKAIVWDANGSLLSTYRPALALYNAFFLPGNQCLYIENSRGLPHVWPLGPAFARRCQILDRTDLIRAGAGGDAEEVLRKASAEDLEEIGDYYLDRADWPTARRFYTRLLELRASPKALQALYHIGEQIGEPYPLNPFYASQDMDDLISHADFFYKKRLWRVAYDLYDKAEPMGQSSRCLNQMSRLTDTLRVDFDMKRYLHLEGNFTELYGAANYLWASRKDVDMARRLFERALSMQYDAYLLQQLYDLCEAEQIPFDTLRFLATENPYELAEGGGFFFEKQHWEMARLLYQKADARAPSPEVRLRLLTIADTLHQPYDFNQMLMFTDPMQFSRLAEHFEEQSQWDRLMVLYQHMDSVTHRTENVIALHRLCLHIQRPFDYGLMLRSESADELRQYASSLNTANTGPTRDQVPLLEKAIQLEEKRLRLDTTASKYSLASYYNNYGFSLLFLPAPKQAENALRKAL
ncbi:MAG TPA: WD40 repeat domain-containing protein, partial [Saprospiraceae bacterium]|nr:WD40 repeat domain-containing protein [Saprospiraceae bacterium]